MTLQCAFGQLSVVHSQPDRWKEEGWTDNAKIISPSKSSAGDILLALSVSPSLSVRPAGYGLRKVDQRRIVKSLATDQVGKLSVACKDLSKAQVIAPR